MTNQTNELANVKSRIRKFLAQTVEAGRTKNEAVIAMTQVGKLLAQFNLQMTDILLTEEVCVKEAFATGSKTSAVAVNVSVNLAKFTDVKVWMTRTNTEIVLNFFGLETDVAMTIYLLNVIVSAGKTSLDEFKTSEHYVNYTGHRRHLTSNFEHGFAAELNARFKIMYNERIAEETTAAEYHAEQMKERMVGMSEEAKVAYAKKMTGTEIMTVAKGKKVEEEFKKMGMRLRTTYTSRGANHNHSARSAGREAGKNVNLSRPIGGGSKVTGYLK